MKYLISFLSLTVIGVIVWRISSSSNQNPPARLRPTYQPVENTGNATMQFVAAGIPKDEYDPHNPLAAFTKLSDHAVRIFFPTFQYQEIPEPKTTGREVDFLTPCEEPRAVHDALSKAGVKLLLPLEVWYPASAPMPPLEDDPLSQFIGCVGREIIAGVTVYDEAIHVGVPIERVQALYERVKTVDATIPVFMVHAFMTADSDEAMTESDRRAYLEAVLRYSAYADVVGFDIYAIPTAIAKVTTPYEYGAETSYDAAVEDYLLWLQDMLPQKEHLLVLQGFAFADQYSAEILQEMPAELVHLASTAPAPEETRTMLQLARKYDVEYVIWWGQSFANKNSDVWETILNEAKRSSEVSL